MRCFTHTDYIGTHYPRNPGFDWADIAARKAGSPYWQKRVVLQSEDLGHAIRGCDTFMSQLVTASGRSPLWLRRNARWRQSPASPRARAALQRKLQGKDEMDDATKPWANATQGTVNIILTRLAHGSKNRWRHAAKAHNKKAARAQRTNPAVSVGPLPKPTPDRGS